MKTPILLGCLLLLIACKSTQKAQTKNISRLTGVWIQQFDSSVHRVESWMALNDSSYLGFGVLVESDDTIFREDLKILRVGKKWYYVADVDENPEPVFFRLDSIRRSGFVAKNPIHDFPNRIHYTLNKKQLHVEVSGSTSDVLIFEFKKSD